jgi:4-oxalocrotonate tautomerase
MPHITLGVPKSDIDTKRKLVTKLTDIVAETYGVRKEAISIVIEESPPENVSVGGVLLIDKQH